MAGVKRGAVRVGVRKWDADQEAELGGKNNAEIGPMWVEIDGIRIPGDVLVLASHRFESDDREQPGAIGIATFKVIASSYETVDWREPPLALIEPESDAG